MGFFPHQCRQRAPVNACGLSCDTYFDRMHQTSSKTIALEIAPALKSLGFGGWAIHALKGDASSRHFMRLVGPKGQTAIAMVTPADQKPSETAFLQIAKHLTHIGLCSPAILAQDKASGILVLQDLGTSDVAASVKAGEDEGALYCAAIDVLVHLQSHRPPSGLATFTPDVGVAMLEPFFEHFAVDTPTYQRHTIESVILDTLEQNQTTRPVLSLRDFHAENLIWRPEHPGTNRVGLVDFQDAFLAGPEYDLVSLLRDARRDVKNDTFERSLAYFARQTSTDLTDLRRQCAITGVQRNLRILGIFARLAKDHNKPGYMSLVPRVRSHILSDLAHPALQKLNASVTPLLESLS